MFDPGNKQKTILRLLASDGVIEVVFSGILTAEQYDDVLTTVQIARTASEHVDGFSALADRWQLGVDVRRVKM